MVPKVLVELPKRLVVSCTGWPFTCPNVVVVLPKRVVVRLECWAQAKEAETRPARRSACFMFLIESYF